MVKKNFSEYFYNPMTYVGAVLASLALVAEFFLFAIDFLAPNSSQYLGIFTYILLPPFLILGLILIPWGALRYRKRVLSGAEKMHAHHFVFDPMIAHHRNTFFIFLIGTAIVLIMTAIGSYKAFHYTESVRFCGTACHKIMEPEFKTYLNSPHARVKCVDCHIGAGADSYLHSKLAGARQLVKTIQNNYAKPVMPPLKELRPASQICEECHWPGKAYSAIEVRKTYFSDDPSSTPPWRLRMLMHVGSTAQSPKSGIHAHMYNTNDIYYVAEDELRQKISWVKSIDKNGKAHIYTTKDSPYKDKMPPIDKMRKMDCMDCHNRPAHNYLSPQVAINRALEEGKINPAIVMIKLKAVDALSKTYKTAEEAQEKIRSFIVDYYKNKQGEYYAAHQKEIEGAIDQVIAIYKSNFFPEMKARWDIYPNNMGHWSSPGCFRCHDEDHVNQEGKAISKDCNICHTIITQGSPDSLQTNAVGLEFIHPFNDDDSWKSMQCSDCHTGGS